MDPAPGERILFEGRPSWRSILGFYLEGALVAALAGGAVVAITAIAAGGVDLRLVALAVAAVMALVLLIGFLKRVGTAYSISDQRLHIRRGLIARRVQETRIDRVQNVNVSQGVLQRLLQVGTVDFDTAGTTDSDFAFAGVGQPEEVMAAVDRAQRAAGGPAG